jgi:hypothetical protein
MPLKGKKNVMTAVDSLVMRKEKSLRGIFFQGLANITFGTPVDEGRARNSWFFSALKPSSGGERSENKGGVSSIRSINEMPRNILGKKLYFTNNLPYIKKLEYGGYPNPPKNPTGKTAGGFSLQAPNGWVRKELKKMRKEIRKIN